MKCLASDLEKKKKEKNKKKKRKRRKMKGVPKERTQLIRKFENNNNGNRET